MKSKTNELSVSDVILLKRKRGSWDEVWDEDRGETVCVYIGRAIPDNAPHGPNKKESSLLRQLCSISGMSPEQVREVPKYRQMLAKAGGTKYKHWQYVERNKYKGKTPEEIDRLKFSKSKQIPITHLHFNRLYAHELRIRKEEAKRAEEQKIINILSIA